MPRKKESKWMKEHKDKAAKDAVEHGKKMEEATKGTDNLTVMQVRARDRVAAEKAKARLGKYKAEAALKAAIKAAPKKSKSTPKAKPKAKKKSWVSKLKAGVRKAMSSKHDSDDSKLRKNMTKEELKKLKKK